MTIRLADLGMSVLLRFAPSKMYGGADHHRRRFVSIVEGVVTGVASRLVGVFVSLLSVPLTIGYLGPERYGVWVLLGSLLAWVRLADLGIGNGLTNAIAGALGSEQPDLVRTYVSTAVATLSAISLVLGLIIILVWPWIDWNELLAVNSELARAEVVPAIRASIIFFLVSFPIKAVRDVGRGERVVVRAGQCLNSAPSLPQQHGVRLCRVGTRRADPYKDDRWLLQ
jgi:Na+-driven multidrug efflux pump